MGGYEVKFNVYANSQEEADRASQMIKSFITEKANQGIAVTADRLVAAINRYKDNYFVASFFK